MKVSPRKKGPKMKHTNWNTVFLGLSLPAGSGRCIINMNYNPFTSILDSNGLSRSRKEHNWQQFDSIHINTYSFQPELPIWHFQAKFLKLGICWKWLALNFVFVIFPFLSFFIKLNLIWLHLFHLLSQLSHVGNAATSRDRTQQHLNKAGRRTLMLAPQLHPSMYKCSTTYTPFYGRF